MPLVTLTSSQTWTAPAGVTSVSVLVVAGGGGGGGAYTTSTAGIGGGGGGGGVVYNGSYTVTPGNGYAVVVGSGGVGGGATGSAPGNGGNSSFDGTGIVATGGGGGGSYNISSDQGFNGGSGGGGGYNGAAGTGTAGQGNNGGISPSSANAGGGGGGAGGVGAAGVAPSLGGNGGPGNQGTFYNSNFPTTYYGAGGGGGSYGGTPGAAGSTGGSAGTNNSTTPATPTANTGNGGGGWGNAGGNQGTGAPGASGVVIIYYSTGGALLTTNAVYDFPNPRGPKRSLALIGVGEQPQAVINTLLNVVYSTPFNLTEWPVPKGPRRLIEYPYNNPGVDELTTIIHKDQFYGPPGMGPPNYDWPVPKGPAQQNHLYRGFTENELLKLITEAVLHNQYDWPVPKGKQYPSDLRTFIQGLNQPIFNNTQFFYAQGEAPRYDYPNPRGKPYPHTLYSEVLRAILSSTPPYSYGIILG